MNKDNLILQSELSKKDADNKRINTGAKLIYISISILVGLFAGKMAFLLFMIAANYVNASKIIEAVIAGGMIRAV